MELAADPSTGVVHDGGMVLVVRRAAVEDWAVLRSLRLRALEVDSDAFGSTLDHELAQPEVFWRERISQDAWFLAWANGQAIGTAAAVAAASGASAERQLDAMWVDPAYRGRGIANALTDAVCAWAKSQGATSLSLTVIDGNETARRLYLRLGFRPTGEREPRPRNPAQIRERLRLRLLPTAAGS
ncbi:GNAT family N-acetyltransferase [Streptomyces sp. NPDC086549]|uniref:GNAT family N-acetyltransferase n=1 Tax=Streptomyces sp. NPDC086549 TaxID=3365752 RepID=UPI0038256376